MIRNLGQVAAIYIGSSAPRNTNLIWLDNTVVPFVFRAYDGSAWSELATHKWVRAYVDGWLVTLPPRQLADDGDYMLINSNNVNYKITVKDFVKSAVGNPLDFKGVIRVSADFPNPSTLEAGDMYVIITSPVGGTVTDPYSGKTFEDSEKIVWDEVTRSWESLGKINITVNLTTSYSETEVTIHSSAGKETTIQGATDQLAGVMLPGQYSWLQALSNGSIVPGDPSPLTPLTPAHKHNYNDIINRLVSQQGTGESTIDPMSQKATTDALNLKFDKASVLQVSGAATDKVMSQKAVTDALKTLSDDFNNKLTNYLPLAGGTMKGNIRFPIGNGIVCNDVSGTAAYVVLRTWNANNSTRMYVGTVNFPTYISSTASDLIHDRNGSSYLLWDSFNLKDPAKLSGNNTFTGNNIFQAGKFNVGPFEVISSGSLLSNISSPAGSAWSRSLVFRANNDIPSSLVFGGYNSVDNTSIGYVYIGIGDVNYQTAQYKFRPTSLTVPIAWSLDDPSGNALVWSQSSTLAHLGRTSGTTKIRSGNVNLIHTKGTTDYTILDSSNYTEFLPQNITWTYGFISQAVDSTGYDANSMIGADKPKLLFNYYTPGKIVNAPTGMSYGNVLQIDGPYTSSYNEAALKTQLAFDIIHNVDNGTGQMWYRTANNKGMAVANWRRVLTADENIAGLSFDGNNYPAIIRVDGTTYPWLRANGNGFLPNVEKSLASGGASQLGSSSWAFLAGYISSVYTNKLVFGVTGPYMIASTNAFQFLNSAGGVHKVATGSLYVGTSYASDALSLVPANGIYSRGIIYIENGIGFRNSIWTNDLTPNRNYSGYLQVLDAHATSSTGGPTNYGTVLQVNSRNAHWANQLWFSGGAEASKNGLYYRHMAYNETTYGEWNRLLTNKDVNILSASYNNNNPNSLPTNQIFYAETQGVAGTPTANGLLFSVQGDDEGIQLWAGSNRTELYYRTKWTSFGSWIKLATTSNLGNYLPLSGGTISSSKSNPLIINSTHVSQSSINFSREGVDKGTVGFYESLGSFLQNDTGETLAVTSNGAFYGVNIKSLRRLVTVTDLDYYLPLTGGTLSGYLIINAVGSTTLAINNNDTNGSETFMRVLRKGTASAAIGFMDSLGAYIYNYNSNKYLFIDNDGYARVGTTNGSTRLALITDIPSISGYLPLSGGTMTGALTMNNRRENVVVDVVAGIGNNWNEGAGALSVQVPSDNGQTPLILARRYGATINTTTLSERLLDMALLDNGTVFKVGMSGAVALELEVTSFTNKVGTGKLFGKQIATTDQIPSIPSISISNSGSGNAVTSITANGHTLTVTKGATYLTSSALNGYATQAWVNSQNFVKSTSTKKVTDIQPVDALPATQASGVLYLVFG